MSFNLDQLLPLEGSNVNTLVNLGFRSLSKPKVHTYFESNIDEEFCLEPSLDCSGRYTMTAQGSQVKQDDYIYIRGIAETRLYRVLTIDYYDASHSDLWIAELSSIRSPKTGI
jgi:hypothetical protein